MDLVFIQPWTSNIDAMWEEPSFARYLQRLATFSRLLCFDKRGTGVSDPVPLPALPTMEQWMDDVRIVMEAARSERAALLGHADGGQMAILFPATPPQRHTWSVRRRLSWATAPPGWFETSITPGGILPTGCRRSSSWPKSSGELVALWTWSHPALPATSGSGAGTPALSGWP